MTQEKREAELRSVLELLRQGGAEALISHLKRRWRDGPPGETGDQMLVRLGRLDALADIERLREQARGE